MVHEESAGRFDTARWTVVHRSTKSVNVTKCGGLQMLGGYGQLSDHKLITIIPLDKYKYTQIKVQVTFHFIDAWAGQFAYMKLPKSDMYLWTDNCDFTLTKNSFNICGSDVSEVKFSTQFEINI